MQSLWNRAGQAHRTGCKACGTAINALGRRATTAAQRRKPTFAEIFTACYSSVFATAAVVDAMVKEDRRKDLDRQLEEARHELKVLLDQDSQASPGTENSTDELNLRQMNFLWKALKKIHADRPYLKEIDKPATIPASELLDSLRHDYYGCPTEEKLRAGRKIDYAALERAIMEEESSNETPSFGPRSEKHLWKDTSATLDVVQKLLERAAAIDKDATPSPAYDDAQEMAQSRKSDYLHRATDWAKAQEMTVAVNKIFRDILAAPLGIKEKVGRICYNILIARHSPDIHTYNTLIVAFDKAGYHTLSDALIDSYFHGRFLKPTRSTFVAILKHYKSTNNAESFLRALACITGRDTKTGAKIRRKHVEDIKETKSLQRWAVNDIVRTRTGDYVWEHVPLHQPLVEELIHGLLHFKLFDQAARMFVTSLLCGVRLGGSVVRQLFDECIYALDYKAALRLVRGFLRYQQRWRELLLDGEQDGSYLVNRAYVLLDLCGLGEAGGKISKRSLARLQITEAKLVDCLSTFAEVEASASGTELTRRPRPNDESKSRVLQLESIWKDYVLSRKATASIESKLLYNHYPAEFRTTMALETGRFAVDRSAQLGVEFAQITGLDTQEHAGEMASSVEEEERTELPKQRSIDVDAEPRKAELVLRC
ncbi:hypothetical protein K4F52_007971 [Lecanicillium sp. MT-2017a]|nr:hypothetical protein K4F52_007971 [Lecanicillium sp. MT-2017a]